MEKCIAIVTLLLLLNHDISALEKNSREKRCIVIQKQSGGRPDSADDEEDYEYKKPEPKIPVPDRLQHEKTGGLLKKDVETLSPELQNYQVPNTAMFRRLKNKIRNFFQ